MSIIDEANRIVNQAVSREIWFEQNIIPLMKENNRIDLAACESGYIWPLQLVFMDQRPKIPLIKNILRNCNLDSIKHENLKQVEPKTWADALLILENQLRSDRET